MSATAERGFPDGRVATAKINLYLGLVLEGLADAYLYLGDLQNLTASVPPPGSLGVNRFMPGNSGGG